MASVGLWSISGRWVQFCMSIKALCLLWMTLAVVRPVSVSAQAGRQAGRQACSEDAAAGQGPGTGMLCVLFKQWLVSVQAWRSWGKEVAACLHSWIVLWAPQCLMHFCSNIHKCGDDPHWCRCSQLCLHPAFALCLDVCLWTMKQWKTDSHHFLSYCGCLLLEPGALDDR